jgi:hypothetical protein
MAFKNALRGIRDPNSPEGQLETDRAYFNAGFGDKRAAMRASEEASRKAYNEEQKQLEEEGYAAHREISSDPTDERIAERNRQIQNDIRYSADKKALAADNAGRLINMPYEQRKIEMAQSGATVAERKRSILQQTTGNNANIIAIPAFGGAATTLSSTRMGLTPEQQLGVPVGYDEGSASLDARNKNLDAKLVELNNPKTTPERAKALEGEIQQDRRSIAAQQQDQESMRLAAQQAKQPLDAKERLMKNYYAGIAAGRSPRDPEMMDMMAQIEHNRSFAPPARTDIKVNSYEPASVAAQKEYIKEVSTTRGQLKNAKGTINSIDKAIALVPSSAQFMGPGGEPLLNATSFLNNRLGLNIDTKGITDATELRTRIFFNIMDNLKKMDAQPSQLQQEIMQQALGTLGTDPKALPNVLKAFQDVIRGKVEDYNKDVTDAESRGVKFPYKPQIDLGASSGRMPPTSGAVAYLKANPGMRADFEAKFGPGSADKVLGKGK